MCILEKNILEFVHIEYCFVQNMYSKLSVLLVLKGQGEYYIEDVTRRYSTAVLHVNSSYAHRCFFYKETPNLVPRAFPYQSL
jgi:hypothetical protein